MKGVLTFNLPEEREEFELAQNGWKYSIVIYSILEKLREDIKYKDKETLNIEEFRQFIWDLMNEYNLKD